MDKEKYYDYLWLISPIWNWVVSIPFFFIWDSAYIAFGLTPPASPVWLYMFLGIVVIFGIAYFMIYKNREKRLGRGA